MNSNEKTLYKNIEFLKGKARIQSNNSEGEQRKNLMLLFFISKYLPLPAKNMRYR